MRRRRRVQLRRVGVASLGGAAVGVLVGGACAGAGGTSLGTLLGPIALCAGIAPQRANRRFYWFFLLFLTLGIALAWASFTDIRPGVVLASGAVLLTWNALLASLARCRSGTLRAAAVTLFAWAWLAWPIWLGPTLAARAAAPPIWVTAVHPVFAVNAVAAPSSGVWTQLPLAYQLTPLGQDVPYALPATIWPCALAQAGTCGLLLAARWRPKRR